MENFSDTRIGIIGIVIYHDADSSEYDIISKLNTILSYNSKIIVGRMGVPYKERGVSVISLIVDGTLNEINALTGKLGKIKGLSVKTSISKNINKRSLKGDK